MTVVEEMTSKQVVRSECIVQIGWACSCAWANMRGGGSSGSDCERTPTHQDALRVAVIHQIFERWEPRRVDQRHPIGCVEGRLAVDHPPRIAPSIPST
jgi:hypothetical protein